MHRPAIRDGFPFTDLDGGAQAQVRAALDHQRGQRAIALDLRTSEPSNLMLAASSVEAATSSPSRRVTAGRVLVVDLGLQPGLVQPNRLDADGTVFEQVFLEQIGHSGILADCPGRQGARDPSADAF